MKNNKRKKERATGTLAVNTSADVMTASHIPTPSPIDAPDARHRWNALIVFAVTFITYLMTMPTLVVFEDPPIFNMLCYYGQPAHPPGYPLYSMLCYPFSHLPFLTPAIAGNVLSALFGSAACSVLYFITRHLTQSVWAAYIAAFAYGFSELFWSQSIIQEVYTLHALLFLLTVFMTLLYVRYKDPKFLTWLAFVYGLALANHWPLIVLASAGILLLLVPVWKSFWAHLSNLLFFFKLLAIFLAAAVLPYLYILVSNIPSDINFLGPIDNWFKFWFYVARTGYSGVDNQLVSWFDKWMFARFLATGVWVQFGAIFAPFVIAGFILQWFRWHWSLCLGLVLMYLSSSYLLLTLLNFSYTELYASVFGIYQLHAYSVFALWGGLCAQEIFVWIRKVTQSKTVVKATTVAAVLFLSMSVGWANWQHNDRSGAHFAYDYSELVLQSIEKDAILITLGDLHMPILKRYILDKVRPDVTVYNSQGLLLGKRYVEALTSDKNKKEALLNLIENEDRPVYYFIDFAHPYGVEDFGLYKKIRKDWPAGKRQLSNKLEFMQLWKQLEIEANDTGFDRWVKREFRKTLTPILVLTRQIDLAEGGFYEVLGFLKHMLLTQQTINGQVTWSDLVERAEQLMPAHVHPEDYATFLVAKASYRESDFDLVSHFEEALQAYPSDVNIALQLLAQVYTLTNENDKFLELIDRYPKVLGQHDSIKKHYEKLKGSKT